MIFRHGAVGEMFGYSSKVGSSDEPVNRQVDL